LTIVALTNLAGGLPIQFVDDIARFYLPKMNEDNSWDINYGNKMLRKLVPIKGFDKAIDIAKQLQVNDGAKFNVHKLNSWGYQLLENNQPQQALEVFKLNVYLFPKVANVFDSLGETYAGKGDFAKALFNYKKVLELDPNNEWATKQIALIKQKL